MFQRCPQDSKTETKYVAIFVLVTWGKNISLQTNSVAIFFASKLKRCLPSVKDATDSLDWVSNDSDFNGQVHSFVCAPV